ncbi:MAG: FHA domain-containing protein [Planctomycetota bacterium]
MFDRFIRLSQAKAALREGRYEDALRIAADPLIRDTRQAERLVAGARGGLLDRARQRLGDGDLVAARAVFTRLAAAAPNEQVDALGRELEAAEGTAKASDERARAAVAEARSRLGEGDLDTAAALLAGNWSGGEPADVAHLRGQIEERRRRAADVAAEAARMLDAGRVTEARPAVVRALALAATSREAMRQQDRLLVALAEQAAATIRERLRAGDVAGALAVVRAAAGEPLGAGVVARMGPAVKALQSDLVGAFRGLDSIADGTRLAQAVRDARLDVSEPLASLVAALLESGAAEGGKSAASRLLQAAERIDATGLVRRAAPIVAAEQRAAAVVEEAQRLAAAGDLDAARERLVSLLTDDPLHEAARRELTVIEQGLENKMSALAAARAAARAGRLEEAVAVALAIGGTGRAGAEAQILLTDLRARIALVQRGVDEVRSSLHGRAACSLPGVRHALARVEALLKVQQDHADLNGLRVAIQAEIDGLHALEAVDAALARGDVKAAVAAVVQVTDRRGQLISPARLDARLLEVGDRLVARAEGAVAVGEAGVLRDLLPAIEGLAVLGGDVATAGARLCDEADRRAAEARGQVAAGRELLRARDLDAATACLAEATELWPEAAEVRAFGAELAGLSAHVRAIDEAVALAGERDHRGAADRMAAMPPTPPLLRTRIFDMKQQLARAQGLEGAFLLRVDEGGEHLVLRGESIAIGNIRKRVADLPILANVAARHAVIRRSMSFHGGMEDAVVAEEGEVRVAGRNVQRHVLTPGDRVQLGPSLAFTYQRPSKRSLTVAVALQGGFQVAGTDSVLLMKDRGRDGRILLGAGADVHVRVASAQGEVELFASGAGQIRVAAESGTIDGKPFRGEEAVAAGQVIAAAGITFTLLPWQG